MSVEALHRNDATELALLRAEFIAEDELVEINPMVRTNIVNLVRASYGPFEPSITTEVRYFWHHHCDVDEFGNCIALTWRASFLFSAANMYQPSGSDMAGAIPEKSAALQDFASVVAQSQLLGRLDSPRKTRRRGVTSNTFLFF